MGGGGFGAAGGALGLLLLQAAGAGGGKHAFGKAGFAGRVASGPAFGKASVMSGWGEAALSMAVAEGSASAVRSAAGAFVAARGWGGGSAKTAVERGWG